MTVGTTDGAAAADRSGCGRASINPTDIAFAPDGRVLVAEEPGLVRVVTPDGQLLRRCPPCPFAAGRGCLRWPSTRAFAQTRFVYAIYTAPSRTGPLGFTLARFRDDRERPGRPHHRCSATIPAVGRTTRPPRLRAGADGKLVRRVRRRRTTRGAPAISRPQNGKILRLNPDGTTPADQAGLDAHVFVADFHSPRGFDWRPASNVVVGGRPRLRWSPGAADGRRFDPRRPESAESG